MLKTNGLDDAAASGDLDIPEGVWIRGTSPTLAVIDASSLTSRDRMFDVHPNAILPAPPAAGW
jgi:hypothetical protein